MIINCIISLIRHHPFQLSLVFCFSYIMGYAQSKDQRQGPMSKKGQLYFIQIDKFPIQNRPNTVKIGSTSKNHTLFGNIIPYFNMLRHNDSSIRKECNLSYPKLANESCAYDYTNKVNIRGTSISEDCFANTNSSLHGAIGSSQSIQGSVRLYPNLAEENPTYDLPNTVDFRSRPSTEVYVGNATYRDVLGPISTGRLYPDLAAEFSNYDDYDTVDFGGGTTSEACLEKTNYREQRYNNQSDPWAPPPPAYTPSAGSWAPPAYSSPLAPRAPPAYSVEPTFSLPRASTPPAVHWERPAYLAPPTSSMSPHPRAPPAYLAPPSLSVSKNYLAPDTTSVSPTYLAPPTSLVSPTRRATPALDKKTPKKRNKNKVRLASSTYLAPPISSAPPIPKSPVAYSTTLAPPKAPRAPIALTKTLDNQNKRRWVAQPSVSAPSTPKTPVYSTTLAPLEAPRRAPSVKNPNRNKNKACMAPQIYSAKSVPSKAHAAPQSLAEKATKTINNDMVWASATYVAPPTPKTRVYEPSEAPKALPAFAEKPSRRRNRNGRKKWTPSPNSQS